MYVYGLLPFQTFSKIRVIDLGSFDSLYTTVFIMQRVQLALLQSTKVVLPP